jgi:hypothetical protein
VQPTVRYNLASITICYSPYRNGENGYSVNANGFLHFLSSSLVWIIPLVCGFLGELHNALTIEINDLVHGFWDELHGYGCSQPGLS